MFLTDIYIVRREHDLGIKAFNMHLSKYSRYLLHSFPVDDFSIVNRSHQNKLLEFLYMFLYMLCIESVCTAFLSNLQDFPLLVKKT